MKISVTTRRPTPLQNPSRFGQGINLFRSEEEHSHSSMRRRVHLPDDGAQAGRPLWGSGHRQDEKVLHPEAIFLFAAPPVMPVAAHLQQDSLGGHRAPVGLEE